MPFTLKSGDEYIFDATQTKETMLRSQVRATILPEIVKALDDAYSTFELMEGERPELREDGAPDLQAAWENKLDDQMFELFQGDVVKVVGQHNVGETFGSTEMWDDTSRRMAAEKLANAIAKHIPITVPEQPVAQPEDVGAVARPGKATFSLEDVMSELRSAHPDADDLDLYDVLEGCEDSDDLLALSSATRALPANPERLREACRAMAAIHKGGTWIDEMLKVGKGEIARPDPALLLADAHARQRGENIDGSPRRETVPAAPPSTPASADRAAKITDIVARLSKISAHTDQAMAETLGMSRSHFIAVKTGKKTVDWTPQQLEAIGAMAEELRESANMLTNDLGGLS